jgi:hypothetical protein
MTRGCNDCTVGPVVSLFEAIRDESVQLRFDTPLLDSIRWGDKAEPPVFSFSGGFAVKRRGRKMTERNHGKCVKADFWRRNRSRERRIPSIGCP